MKTNKRYLKAVAVLIASSAILTVNAHERAGGVSSFDLNDDGIITAQEITTASAAQVQELQSQFLEQYDSVPNGQQTGDGVITPEESRAVHEAKAEEWLANVLERFDTNEDGAISSADNSRTRGRGGLRHLAELDANNDGTVSSAELTAAAEAMAADLQERFLEKYDSVPTGGTTGDGTITTAESLAVHQDKVAERVEAFLERFDLNDDGTVTSAEIDEVHAQANAQTAVRVVNERVSVTSIQTGNAKRAHSIHGWAPQL